MDRAGSDHSCRWLIHHHYPQQVLGILGDPSLLSDLLVAGANLPNFIEMHEAMTVTLHSLNELAMRFSVWRQEHIRAALDERLPEFGMIFAMDLRHLGRILFHLGPSSCKVILHGAACLPYS